MSTILNNAYTSIYTTVLTMIVALAIIFILTRLLNKNKSDFLLFLKNIAFFGLMYYFISRVIITLLESTSIEIFQPVLEPTGVDTLWKGGAITLVMVSYSLLLGGGMMSIVRIVVISIFCTIALPFVFTFPCVNDVLISSMNPHNDPNVNPPHQGGPETIPQIVWNNSAKMLNTGVIWGVGIGAIAWAVAKDPKRIAFAAGTGGVGGAINELNQIRQQVAIDQKNYLLIVHEQENQRRLIMLENEAKVKAFNENTAALNRNTSSSDRVWLQTETIRNEMNMGNAELDPAVLSAAYKAAWEATQAAQAASQSAMI